MKCTIGDWKMEEFRCDGSEDDEADVGIGEQCASAVAAGGRDWVIVGAED